MFQPLLPLPLEEEVLSPLFEFDLFLALAFFPATGSSEGVWSAESVLSEVVWALFRPLFLAGLLASTITVSRSWFELFPLVVCSFFFLGDLFAGELSPLLLFTPSLTTPSLATEVSDFLRLALWTGDFLDSFSGRGGQGEDSLFRFLEVLPLLSRDPSLIS